LSLVGFGINLVDESVDCIGFTTGIVVRDVRRFFISSLCDVVGLVILDKDSKREVVSSVDMALVGLFIMVGLTYNGARYLLSDHIVVLLVIVIVMGPGDIYTA